jgi:hypothetical protein
VIEPLAGDQRQRLAALLATRDLMPPEIDVWDVIRYAHWVWCAQELDVAGYPPVNPPRTPADSVNWQPAVLD